MCRSGRAGSAAICRHALPSRRSAPIVGRRPIPQAESSGPCAPAEAHGTGRLELRHRITSRSALQAALTACPCSARRASLGARHLRQPLRIVAMPGRSRRGGGARSDRLGEERGGRGLAAAKNALGQNESARPCRLQNSSVRPRAGPTYTRLAPRPNSHAERGRSGRCLLLGRRNLLGRTLLRGSLLGHLLRRDFLRRVFLRRGLLGRGRDRGLLRRLRGRQL